jgi:hypothetical protein
MMLVQDAHNNNVNVLNQSLGIRISEKEEISYNNIPNSTSSKG